jgi:hypothetical protein
MKGPARFSQRPGRCFHLLKSRTKNTSAVAGGVSGVIAVVVFGLYGSATGKWHMSPRVVESGSFDIFWDTVCFAFNSLVFFFAGASSINFFWRSSQVRLLSLNRVLEKAPCRGQPYFDLEL